MNNENFFKYCFGAKGTGFPGTVILTPIFPLKLFKENCEVVSSFSGRLYSGFILKKNGKSFAVVHCGMGSSLVGDAVMLLSATPVKKMVFLGAAGGLSDAKIGDIVVGGKAFDGEGFTRYYSHTFGIKKLFNVGEYIESSWVYTRKLMGFLSENLKNKLTLKIGDIFTIGSMVAETRATLHSLEEKDFLGIDLELSACFAAAKKVRIEAAGVLFITDLPLKEPLWGKEPPREKFDLRLAELARVLVEFVTSEEG